MVMTMMMMVVVVVVLGLMLILLRHVETYDNSWGGVRACLRSSAAGAFGKVTRPAAVSQVHLRRDAERRAMTSLSCQSRALVEPRASLFIGV